MKPNWMCSNCDLWSNRRSGVKHHIINLHNENATFDVFIDYVIGRQSGKYQASSSSGSPVSKTGLN